MKFEKNVKTNTLKLNYSTSKYFWGFLINLIPILLYYVFGEDTYLKVFILVPTVASASLFLIYFIPDIKIGSKFIVLNLLKIYFPSIAFFIMGILLYLYTYDESLIFPIFSYIAVNTAFNIYVNYKYRKKYLENNSRIFFHISILIIISTLALIFTYKVLTRYYMANFKMCTFEVNCSFDSVEKFLNDSTRTKFNIVKEFRAKNVNLIPTSIKIWDGHYYLHFNNNYNEIIVLEFYNQNKTLIIIGGVRDAKTNSPKLFKKNGEDAERIVQTVYNYLLLFEKPNNIIIKRSFIPDRILRD